MIDCARCQGTGEIVTDWRVHLEDDLTGDSGVAECPDCDGRGDGEEDLDVCTDCGDDAFAEDRHFVEGFERFGAILCDGCFRERCEEEDE